MGSTGTTPLDYATTGDISNYIEQLATSASTAVSGALVAMITRNSRLIDTYTGRRFYTSTGDEVRIFDGPRWNRDPYVPAPGLSYWFGSQRFMPNIDIVSVTTLQLAAGTNDAQNGTYVTINANDYFLEPQDRRDGWPAMWLEMSDSPVGTYTTASYQWFSPGKNTVKITGRFGWNSTTPTTVPDDIRDCVIQLVVREWKARDSAFSDVVGVDSLGTAVISRAMPYSVRMILDQYRRIQIS